MADQPTPSPCRDTLPVIEISPAEKHWRSGKPVRVWRNAEGAVVAFVRLVASPGRTISFDYAATGEASVAPTRDTTILTMTQSLGSQEATHLSCPGCKRNISALYLRDQSWACLQCHRLSYRSQRLTPEQNAFAKLDELNRQWKAGRPKGMHQTTWDRLDTERSALRKSLRGKKRTTPHAGLGKPLRSNWLGEGKGCAIIAQIEAAVQAASAGSAQASGSAASGTQSSGSGAKPRPDADLTIWTSPARRLA